MVAGVKRMEVLKGPVTVVCCEKESGLTVMSGHAEPGRDKEDESQLLGVLSEENGGEVVNSVGDVLERAKEELEVTKKAMEKGDKKFCWVVPSRRSRRKGRRCTTRVPVQPQV